MDRNKDSSGSSSQKASPEEIRIQVFGKEIASLLFKPSPILVEQIPLMKFLYRRREMIRVEFFMPKDIPDCQDFLHPKYFSAHKEFVQAFQGNLRWKLKEVHHIQIAPFGITQYFDRLQASDEAIREEKERVLEILNSCYFPGPVYKFEMLIDSVLQGNLIPEGKRTPYILVERNLDEMIQTVNFKQLPRHDDFVKLALNKFREVSYTVRETLEIKKYHDMNMTGTKRVGWMLKLAFLSGRTPESIKNFLKYIQKCKTTEEFITFVRQRTDNQIRNGRISFYSHANLEPSYPHLHPHLHKGKYDSRSDRSQGNSTTPNKSSNTNSSANSSHDEVEDGASLFHGVSAISPGSLYQSPGSNFLSMIEFPASRRTGMAETPVQFKGLSPVPFTPFRGLGATSKYKQEMPDLIVENSLEYKVSVPSEERSEGNSMNSAKLDVSVSREQSSAVEGDPQFSSIIPGNKPNMSFGDEKNAIMKEEAHLSKEEIASHIRNVTDIMRKKLFVSTTQAHSLIDQCQGDLKLVFKIIEFENFSNHFILVNNEFQLINRDELKEEEILQRFWSPEELSRLYEHTSAALQMFGYLKPEPTAFGKPSGRKATPKQMLEMIVLICEFTIPSKTPAAIAERLDYMEVFK